MSCDRNPSNLAAQLQERLIRRLSFILSPDPPRTHVLAAMGRDSRMYNVDELGELHTVQLLLVSSEHH